MNQTSLAESGTKHTKNFQSTERREVVKNELRWTLVSSETGRKPLAQSDLDKFYDRHRQPYQSRHNRALRRRYAGAYRQRFDMFPGRCCRQRCPVFTDQNSDVLQNPTVVIEIFSNCPRRPGKTKKLEGFLAIPKIKECLLVNEDEMRVEHYARQNAKQWIYRIYNERDDVISLESINCKLSLAEVYAQVKLKESELSSKAVN